MSSNDANDAVDNEYIPSNSSSKVAPDTVPVVRDDANIEDDLGSDPNSDAAVANDEQAAMDESNIIDSRTRGAAPEDGYQEKEEDDLPEQVEDGADGTSSTS